MNKIEVTIARVVFWALLVGLVGELWFFSWLNEW